MDVVDYCLVVECSGGQTKNGGLESGTRRWRQAAWGVTSGGAGDWGVQRKDGHAGGVGRRSSSRERPQAQSLTLDFVAGLHAYDHGWHLWWSRIGWTGLRSVSLCACCRMTIFAYNLFCFVASLLFLACASTSCSQHLLSFFFFLSSRGAGVIVGRGMCSGLGLGPRLEASPSLEAWLSTWIVTVSRSW